jgi:hypothetical protein
MVGKSGHSGGETSEVMNEANGEKVAKEKKSQMKYDHDLDNLFVDQPSSRAFNPFLSERVNKRHANPNSSV